MTTSFNNTTHCAVCSQSNLEEVLHLPNLPLSCTYVRDPKDKDYQGHDLKLLLCPNCNHIQTANELDPELFYTFDDYAFRSSESAVARQRNAALLNFFLKVTKGKKFKNVLEVGCNDFYFLRLIKDHCENLIGLDPIWHEQHGTQTEDGIHIVGLPTEELTTEDFPEKPDLIILSHTLEHIANPHKVLQKLLDIATDDALIIVEIPNFEVPFDRCRFDQVFHQHLHYFNKLSLPHLVERLDCNLIDAYHNFIHWGSFTVCLQKKAAGGSSIKVTDTVKFTKEEIQKRFDFFQRKSKLVGESLSLIKEDVYGFGAGQMLPIFAYHWKNDLSRLKSVLDDDATKSGLSYKNLNVRIEKPSSDFAYDDSSILITAVDSATPILNALKNKDTRRIINPLTFM